MKLLTRFREEFAPITASGRSAKRQHQNRLAPENQVSAKALIAMLEERKRARDNV